MSAAERLAPAGYRSRWDVARVALKCWRAECLRAGKLIGPGEQYRKVTTHNHALCVECAAKQFPEETPPADMPAPSPWASANPNFAIGQADAASTVVDSDGLKVCLAIGCMGSGERCPRCRRTLPAAIREANGLIANVVDATLGELDDETIANELAERLSQIVIGAAVTDHGIASLVDEYLEHDHYDNLYAEVHADVGRFLDDLREGRE